MKTHKTIMPTIISLRSMGRLTAEFPANEYAASGVCVPGLPILVRGFVPRANRTSLSDNPSPLRTVSTTRILGRDWSFSVRRSWRE